MGSIASLKTLRSAIGYLLLGWSLNIFPEKEKLILAKAIANIEKEMKAINY